MSHKSRQLPNGRRTFSDRIRHAKVYPARSPSLAFGYLAIYEDDGLARDGLVDLIRVVITEPVEPGLHKRSQARFELVQVP